MTCQPDRGYSVHADSPGRDRTTSSMPVQALDTD
jgi:hypothetical protein